MLNKLLTKFYTILLSDCNLIRESTNNAKLTIINYQNSLVYFASVFERSKKHYKNTWSAVVQWSTSTCGNYNCGVGAVGICHDKNEDNIIFVILYYVTIIQWLT